jgi:hypothetical protein
MALLRAIALVAAFMVATGTPALASAATPWVHPGMAPYKGTAEAAASLHEKTIGLPVADFMKGVSLFNANQCEEHYLQDGEQLQNTFTKGGVSRSVSTVVAFKDPKTGQSLLANDPKRRSMRCRIPGRTDGATVVFPFVCGNWAVQYLPPVPTPPAPPPPQVQYVPSQRSTIYWQNTPGVYIGGTVVSIGCVCCGQQSVIGTPAISIPPQVSQTTTFGN